MSVSLPTHEVQKRMRLTKKTSTTRSLLMTRRNVYSRAYHYDYVRVGCKVAAREWGNNVVVKFLAGQASQET